MTAVTLPHPGLAFLCAVHLLPMLSHYHASSFSVFNQGSLQFVQLFLVCCGLSHAVIVVLHAFCSGHTKFGSPDDRFNYDRDEVFLTRSEAEECLQDHAMEAFMAAMD